MCRSVTASLQYSVHVAGKDGTDGPAQSVKGMLTAVTSKLTCQMLADQFLWSAIGSARANVHLAHVRQRPRP